MSRRYSYVTAALALACFFASVVIGFSQQSKKSDDAASGEGGIPAGLLSQASGFATLMCGKMSDYVGSNTESLVQTAGAGVAAVVLSMGTLYVLSRYFDSDPFLYNNGKLGKLEAQSMYNPHKKC